MDIIPNLLIKDNRALINTNALCKIVRNLNIEKYGRCDGVLYAYHYAMISDKKYSKYHDTDIRYVRIEDGVINVRNWSILTDAFSNEWYKSQQDFDSFCRLTSRHSYYTYNEIMEQFMTFARTLYVDGLLILANDLERKLVNGDELTHQELIDLVTNVEENVLDLKKDYEDEKRRCDNLENINGDIYIKLDNIVEFIDENIDKCIDRDILSKIRQQVKDAF